MKRVDPFNLNRPLIFKKKIPNNIPEFLLFRFLFLYLSFIQNVNF